jgi:hypothetical protein
MRVSKAPPPKDKTCRKCGVVLVCPDNWTASFKKNQNNICRTCWSANAKVYMKAAGNPMTNRTPGPPGFVYVVQNPAWVGYSKIGRTAKDDVMDRLRSYNTSCPFKDFKLVASARFSDCWLAEAVLHQRMRGCRVGRTEWFNINPDDAATLLHKLDDEIKSN